MTPGIYNLGDIAISVAMTDEVITVSSNSLDEFIGNLDGLDSVTLQCHFSHGGGGATVKCDIETSLDQGLTWIDIARFAFTTTTDVKIANLTTKTPVTTFYTPVTLADNTAVDGILGDMLRAKLTTTGTYTGATTISVRAHVR